MKTSQKIYAGVGSRTTPPNVLATMQSLGKVLAERGWVLRSGNCKGADQAFQSGANLVSANQVELFLPWASYERPSLVLGNVVHSQPSKSAYDIAARYHPAWQNCNQAARAMHARNVHIVLGQDLQTPVQLVVCWTPKGQVVGGTGMAMRLAAANGIPLKNLALVSSAALLREVLAGNESETGDYCGQTEFCW